MRKLLTLAAILSLPATSYAGDFWVDPVLGSDLNDGRSPLSAWRTLQFGLSVVNGPIEHRLRLLPGTYGGTFPVTVSETISVVGEGGSEQTFVNAGSRDGFLFRAEPASGQAGVTQLRGVTIQDALTGIRVAGPGADGANLSFDDVVVRDSSQGAFVGVPPGPEQSIRFSGFVADGCAIGFVVQGGGSILVEDSELVDGIFAGALVSSLLGTPPNVAELTLRRTIVRGTAGANVSLAGNTSGLIRLEDCLIADGGATGVDMNGPFGTLAIEGCTIAGNQFLGLEIPFGAATARVSQSILSGTARDVAVQASQLEITDSLVEDGTAVGPGVLTGDPRFVDPAGGDYRLLFESPAVDVLAPSRSPDLRGRARSVDGDLNLVAGADLGALEARHLEVLGPGPGPQSVVLELRGPVGAKATLVLAGVALSPAAQSTPYGALVLDPSEVVRFLHVALPAGGAPLEVPVLGGGAAAGTTWSAQLWLTSAAAPNGGAFSNGVEFTFE